MATTMAMAWVCLLKQPAVESRVGGVSVNCVVAGWSCVEDRGEGEQVIGPQRPGVEGRGSGSGLVGSRIERGEGLD